MRNQFIGIDQAVFKQCHRPAGIQRAGGVRTRDGDLLKERPIHVAFVGQVDNDEIPPNPEPHKADDWQWVELKNLPEGKWFRMSKEALRYFSNQKDSSGFVIDFEYRL